MATRSWIVPNPSRHDVDGVARLRVQLVAGSVTVVGHDSPGVRVDVAEIDGNPLELTVEGDRLTIGYPFLGWDGWAKRLRSYRSTDTAHVTVHVPRATAVAVATALAAASVDDVAEDLSLTTASGRLRVTGCRGAVSLRSASGSVDVSGHDGPVRVSTAAGRTTLSGDLPRVEVTTVAGAVEVATSSRTSMVDLSTVSGSLKVSLPTGTGVSLTARTVAGGVRVDGVDHRSPGLGATTVEERSGDGICFLSTRSISGNLDVGRAAVLPGAPQ